ncbi:Rieske (2Fe-2S) protein [Halieaceae bacterium IMCC14734]|uniref:cholesterol 7-desaturase n=1 Tax=Candidatus Litorirhabdus singularis TaxID=2518993 RepID=A0ABT3TMF2_9GAMM|nr:Rieske 2Fe-2S domain-containing protein [Candidatus Litorirhabdus singularis]MCX2982502.1 Rieske (2Fe-2S) protein [Candidatus Litorirhabdus singularis]
MNKRFPMPMPFGWFCIGYGDELAVGEVKNVHYFDRDMVLFRTESGKIGLSDPVCPHLGAHLGHGGTVQGESIRCAFHHWQYDTQGVITDIPYASRIPPKWEGKPCLKTYPVCEKNEVIWAWYHPEDAAPDQEVIELDEIKDPEWVDQERYFWSFDSCPQEIAENGVDVAHFKYIHNMDAVPQGETTFEGHIRRSKVRGPRTMTNAAGEQVVIESGVDVVQNGAGQKWTRFSGMVDYLLQVLVTPVNDERVEVRFAYTHKKYPEDSFEYKTLREGIAATNGQRGLDGDIPIWQNKFHLREPILCDGDGPIMRFRKYFAQFYVGGPYGDEGDMPSDLEAVS